jgi:DNA-binding transcriptional LysR family regulator
MMIEYIDQRRALMDFRQLMTFRVLAMTLNFHQAAGRLNYVQSTVTAQIQALEEELGTRLFDRLGKRVTLTDAGARLLPYAEHLLKVAEEARLAISEQQELAGTVTISATETLCTYRLPAVLHQFRLSYPQIQILFSPSPYTELRRAVTDGSVDLAFVLEEPITTPTLHVEPLLSEPIHLVASPAHPLAQQPALLPSDLDGETLLMTEAGCAYRVQFQHQLSRNGVQPNMLEFGSIEAIKQCTMAGMGIAVLPAIAVATEVSQKKLVVLPWGGELICLTMQMIRHKQKWLSPALQVFIQVVQQMFSETAIQP